MPKIKTLEVEKMDYNRAYMGQMNPYQQLYQQYNTPPAYSGQIVQVNGKAGAEAFKMEPNSTIYLQDTTQGNRIFLCMTDGAGYKTVRGIIGTFEEDQEKAQRESVILALEARIKALEDTINGYASSDAFTRNESATAASQKNDGYSQGGGKPTGND